MNQETVFDFVKNPTKENFLKSRELVINSPDYDPYSEDLTTMEKLFEDKAYEKLNYYVTVNVLLSPKAHFIKYLSLKETGNAKAAESIMFICYHILNCIEKTGDGTMQNPYIVTRVSDETDFLHFHLRKKHIRQKLIQSENKYMDVLTLEDGSELYFDITAPYRKIAFSEKRNEE